MKKYLYVLVLFFLYILVNNDNRSVAYDCMNKVVYLNTVNTKTLEDYLNSINYNQLNYFCSYDYCYQIREGNINKSINNFNKLYLHQLKEDDYYYVINKGFPITKININNC